MVGELPEETRYPENVGRFGSRIRGDAVDGLKAGWSDTTRTAPRTRLAAYVGSDSRWRDGRGEDRCESMRSREAAVPNKQRAAIKREEKTYETVG